MSYRTLPKRPFPWILLPNSPKETLTQHTDVQDWVDSLGLSQASALCLWLFGFFMAFFLPLSLSVPACLLNEICKIPHHQAHNTFYACMCVPYIKSLCVCSVHCRVIPLTMKMGLDETGAAGGIAPACLLPWELGKTGCPRSRPDTVTPSLFI